MNALINSVRATPPDRLSWKPLEQGRTVQEQLVECVLANRQWADILRHRAYARLPRKTRAEAEAELDTPEKAISQLYETTGELISAIQSVPDEELGRLLSVPQADGVDLTLAECCLHAYWNMVYHEGQISYIRTLYNEDGSPQSAEEAPSP